MVDPDFPGFPVGFRALLSETVPAGPAMSRLALITTVSGTTITLALPSLVIPRLELRWCTIIAPRKGLNSRLGLRVCAQRPRACPGPAVLMAGLSAGLRREGGSPLGGDVPEPRSAPRLRLRQTPARDRHAARGNWTARPAD